LIEHDARIQVLLMFKQISIQCFAVLAFAANDLILSIRLLLPAISFPQRMQRDRAAFFGDLLITTIEKD